MCFTRSCMGSKSRTTSRTSCRICFTRAASFSRSSSVSGRSTSKCMTDSRWLASRPESTRSMRPSSSRIVPTTGCSNRLTTRLRAKSSSLTESTRNGESSVLVSITDPTVS